MKPLADNPMPLTAPPNVIAVRDRVPPPRPPRMRYTADIETHNGWWFKYRVKRLHGFGIPESCYAYRRTLNGARKAAERWCRQNEKNDGEVVERHGRLFADDAVPSGVVTK